MNRLNRYLAEKDYAAKLALLESIHNETGYIEQIEAMRHADDLLERTLRGNEFQGYANTPGCSRLDIYTMGNMRGSESLISPDSFESCVIAGMDKAESVSRNIADNNL